MSWKLDSSYIVFMMVNVNIQLHIDFTMHSKRSIQVQLNYETRQMSRYKYSAGRLTQTPGTYRVCSNYEMF